MGAEGRGNLLLLLQIVLLFRDDIGVKSDESVVYCEESLLVTRENVESEAPSGDEKARPPQRRQARQHLGRNVQRVFSLFLSCNNLNSPERSRNRESTSLTVAPL